MKILVPVDGSSCSRATLEWAARTFDRATTDYHLLHVVYFLPEIPCTGSEVADAQQILNEAKGLLKSLGCNVANSGYALGDAVTEINKYAEFENVDQILMGSHGRTGLSRLLMGSVSVAVLKSAKRPVLIHQNVQRSLELGGEQTVPEALQSGDADHENSDPDRRLGVC